ncbi:hypothetical protein ABH940_006691 [Streptacidiphilus sp. BW17]|uniref:hypothetical protein n=1 Tax=Streptacidiphilus sp. BW17 TaxID=3156274 RepID=UPI003518A3C2
MSNYVGGGASSGDDANSNPGPDADEAQEQPTAEVQPAVGEPAADRGITDPSEISG